MLGSILVGLTAATIVVFSQYLHSYFSGVIWASPLFILGVGAFAMILQKFVLNRRPGNPNYDGLADLFLYIHQPTYRDSPVLWLSRGVISFLLAFFGAHVGLEGPSIEITHAFIMRARIRTSRWFEQKRRTDAGVSLAAGVSAAFGAPFAGILLPMELGVGGRNLSVALSSLAAFLGLRFLLDSFSLSVFDVSGVLSGFRVDDWREWLGVLVIGVVGGVFGAGLTRFVRYCQDSLLSLLQTRAWMRVLTGAVFLSLVFFIFKPAHRSPSSLLESVLWLKFHSNEVLLLLFTQVLSFALILSGFGTAGVFWPLFAMGGCLGFGVNYWILRDLNDFTAASGLLGGAALWGAVLGTPLSAAVLVFEMTQNLPILFPCLVVAWTARSLARALGTPPFVYKDLEARGLNLIGGKSASILNQITVKDAMTTDHEMVHEQEPISELHSRILKARYPFFPMVDTQGIYKGLLTADMIQEGWLSEEKGSSGSRILEAKDLLYRAKFRSPTLKVSDRLTATVGLFNDFPCVPVLGEDKRVMGLLFAYHVRLAYDREVTRTSFSFARDSEGY